KTTGSHGTRSVDLFGSHYGIMSSDLRLMGGALTEHTHAVGITCDQYSGYICLQVFVNLYERAVTRKACGLKFQSRGYGPASRPSGRLHRSPAIRSLRPLCITLLGGHSPLRWRRSAFRSARSYRAC